jgi:hypothetical protein
MGIGIGEQGHAMLSSPFFVNLDLSNLFGNGFSSGILSLGSELGAQYQVCSGNAIGSLGSNCIGGISSSPILVPISWTSSSSILGITTTTPLAGVSIQSLTLQSQAVPEPGTLTLLASGIIGLMGLGLRRKLQTGHVVNI